MPEKRFSFEYPQKWVQGLVLFGFCFVLFFVNLGQWDLWNPDEPRYAQVAREMTEGGNWILPRLNKRIYPDKPPVFFWLIALSYAVSGEVSPFSARFPSALAGHRSRASARR